MATLVHDDLIDQRSLPARQGGGLGELTAPTRRGRPATTCSRGRSPSSPPRATDEAVGCLAERDARPRARRGAPAGARRMIRTRASRLPRALRPQDREALRGRLPPRQRRRRRASARSASRSGSRSRSQTTSSTAPGETIETGKIAGTDLREGTPTLPLILAAREDDTVRAALAGGPLDGALDPRRRDRSARGRRARLALDYARQARACLDGNVRRAELRRP